ncbi:hypothetical protein HYH02_001679 [Chlamydomonas schloesseri]|uniref:Uncharacterized protein n=1 Tax=Chlamydomonas schloesseri TaxID=2026947 RepID=A0A836BBM6_9CHLO|nr:hypothetical protein HYH02_001679 [Chlamydomonas schloesseri]|eukprot:KAG2453458.1 hypothetical protein HYH02_001679 [Chlamydomonas schloesseri]
MEEPASCRRSIDAANLANVPGAGANKTIAALEFQAVRIREKKGTFIPAIHHNDILSSATDHHYRNMSHLSASSIPKARSEVRSEVRVMNAPKYEEVEEFASDSEDETEEETGVPGSLLRGTGDGGQASPRQPHTPELDKAGSSSLLDTMESLNAASRLRGGAGGSSRKVANGGNVTTQSVPEMDPVAMLKRMRAEKSSRSVHMLAQEHHPCMSVLKGPGHQVAEDMVDDEGLSVGPHSMQGLRAKSFLARLDAGGGAADDLLAQIRGSGWQSASISLASAARTGGTGGGGCGSSHGGVTAARQLVAGSSKSFTAPSRKNLALPGVSVDSSPRLMSLEGMVSAAPNSNSGAHGVQGAGSQGGGIFSKLKSMMKRG